MRASATSYDEVLYDGHAFQQTHPERLATLATLFGMTPAPVNRSRVLELGCGDGGNLIPLADTLPESEFLGIDLGERHIEKGRETIGALGLRNINLRQGDLMNFSREEGRFDYIIAHGLFSWVPAPVREQVLAICRDHLAPSGVAYLSYNCYPGGHLRSVMRDLMLFLTRELEDPAARVRQARQAAEFFAAAVTKPEAYKGLLRDQLERVRGMDDYALCHDDLEAERTPFYFVQFMREAARHGLQYLSEADFFEMQDQIYAPEVVTTLRQLAGDDLLVKEQLLDFLKGRSFRQTLLCHENLALNREINPSLIRNFFLASSARPVAPEADLRSPEVVVQFRGLKGAGMATDHPLSKAAILSLGELWPQPISFTELLGRAQSRLGHHEAPPDAEVEVLCRLLLGVYAAGLIELHLLPPAFTIEAGARPQASRLARLQARHGTLVTSLKHTTVQIEEATDRLFLQLLDGTRDRRELIRDLHRALQNNGGPAPLSPTPQAVEENLHRLARLALLRAS